MDLDHNIEAELQFEEGEEVFCPGLGYYRGGDEGEEGEHEEDSDSVQEIPQEDNVSNNGVKIEFLSSIEL